MIVYMIKGELPWQGLRRRTAGAKKDELIANAKAAAADTLCDGYPELATIYASVRRLHYADAPHYQLYAACLRAGIRKIDRDSSTE